MSDWKNQLTMPDAPDRFAGAIWAGGEAIGRYEARRRRMLRYGAAAAVLALLVGAGLYAALRGMNPKQDNVLAALGGSPSASAGADEAPRTAVLATPEVHMTPDPTAAPRPTLAPQPAPGALLYGKGPYVADEALVLPETPEIQHASYAALHDTFEPEAFANMLWGDRWALDAGGNYAVSAEENPWGDYEMTGAFAPDGRFIVCSPASVSAAAFASQDEAYEAMRAWLADWLPEEPYLAAPAAVVSDDENPEEPARIYGSWMKQLEGLWVEGCYLDATYTPRGPESFSMTWKEFMPANDDPVPVLLTAAQAVDALNEAITKKMEELYPGRWDAKRGVVSSVNAIYSHRFTAIGAENEYRFAWQLIYAPDGAEESRAAFVDGVTGAVAFSDSERLFATSYTPEEVARLIEQAGAPQSDYLDGEILFGEAGYRLSDAFARGLPETPELAHALYAREPDALDPDDVAKWLWDDDYTKETYDFGVVYVHQAAKDDKSDFKQKGYVFEGDNCFSFSPDDPSNLYVAPFESREAALRWAEKWLRAHNIPQEYFAHPSHPGASYFDGKPVNTTYVFRWDTQVEGVAVRGAGLSGEICAFGPSHFSLDLGRYLPLEAIEGEKGAAMPAYLTAAQAVDALNWAASQEFGRLEEGDPAWGDTAYGSFEDTIEDIRPIFANELFYRDREYRLSWEITVRSAARGSTRTFIVDAAGGQIWNDHDGVADTIYTR